MGINLHCLRSPDIIFALVGSCGARNGCFWAVAGKRGSLKGGWQVQDHQ